MARGRRGPDTLKEGFETVDVDGSAAARKGSRPYTWEIRSGAPVYAVIDSVRTGQVQKDAKARGLSVEQMREAYQERIARLRQGQNG